MLLTRGWRMKLQKNFSPSKTLGMKHTVIGIKTQKKYQTHATSLEHKSHFCGVKLVNTLTPQKASGQ